MVKEEEAIRKREIDEWNAKVVVANKHFTVNTRVLESQQIDKYRSMREDAVQKIGIRLAPNRLKSLTER